MNLTKEINNFLNLGIEFGDDVTDEQALKLIKDAVLEKEYMTKEDAKKDKDISKHFYDQNRITFKVLLEDQFGVDLKDVSGAKEAAKLIKEQVDAQIAELKSSSSEPSEEVASIQAKYDEAIKELALSNSGLDAVKKELQETKDTYAQREVDAIKNQKELTIWDTVKSKLSDAKDEIWLEGFKNKVKSDYSIELDETKEKLVVTDKEGNLLQDPNNVGKKMSPIDVVLSELEKAGGLKKNQTTGGAVPNVTVPNPTPQAQNVRKLHSNAAGA